MVDLAPRWTDSLAPAATPSAADRAELRRRLRAACAPGALTLDRIARYCAETSLGSPAFERALLRAAQHVVSVDALIDRLAAPGGLDERCRPPLLSALISAHGPRVYALYWRRLRDYAVWSVRKRG